MGMTLDKLQMFTCDENWKEEQFSDRVKNSDMIVYKKLQLSNFKIYWNSSERNFIFNESDDQDTLIFKMDKMILK